MGLKLEQARKAFVKGAPIFADLNLEVRDNEFITIVGPSGAGKTTLLRVIAGLDSLDAGKVFIAGKDVTDSPPENRDVAMVFQTHALYPHLTVHGNLEFPLRLRSVKRDEMKRKVAEIATLLKLDSLLQRLPSDLSGGEAQRVALGRALTREPAALLLDEPLSSLPPDLRFTLREELIRLHRDRPRPTVYVTHDHEEALALGQRVAVLHDGKIQQIGTPREIYERPANRFVARFVGRPAMNFFEGDPVRGIRPEQLQFCNEGEAFIKGKITSIQYLGACTDLTVKHATGQATIRTSDPREFTIGETVFLGADEKHIHLFDPRTGLRK